MQKIRWFFLILAIVLALVVALQNNDPATLQLLWIEQSLPLSLLMLSTTAIGFLLGALMTASMLRSRRRAAEKKTKKASSESARGLEPAQHQPANGDVLT